MYKLFQDYKIWLGTTFKDTEGKQHGIPLQHAVIPKGKTESFDIDWTIPIDAPNRFCFFRAIMRTFLPPSSRLS